MPNKPSNPEELAYTKKELLELVNEQKRMNKEMILQLEKLSSLPSMSQEIHYLKVLLDSSSAHISNDLIRLSRQIDRLK
ncbi:MULTISPECIES: hypothetical protein [Bacillus]|uniref:Uncharacterized protein n=2 Tax=Bacillus TaxID=1386 RepID=A0A0M5JEU8_9BACI|nr:MULTISPECIES: hypothetical protein [Bacillus]ALC82439.1 hypothetical protein AM592_13230 [Bacillus gobiensis]MBP1081321.1 hypothetical protein [Bacillus capparidis]MED1095999.1 hypothetical protein [Bacillus capparidis]